jgi:hypothetical protein
VTAAHARRAPAVAAAAIAVVILVAVGIAWAGRVAEGRRALADADSALERGDTTEAIFAARIAGEARCPGCTAPDEGFARLEKIARDAEARGDDTTAFAAWRATRAALLATAVTSADGDRRLHADHEIARFAHRLDAAAVAAGALPTPAAAEDRVRAVLAESDVPGAATFALIGLGGIVFLAAGARFAAARATRRMTDLGLAVVGAAVAAAGALFF